jgi:hypothetical protein
LNNIEPAYFSLSPPKGVGVRFYIHVNTCSSQLYIFIIFILVGGWKRASSNHHTLPSSKNCFSDSSKDNRQTLVPSSPIFFRLMHFALVIQLLRLEAAFVKGQILVPFF